MKLKIKLIILIALVSIFFSCSQNNSKQKGVNPVTNEQSAVSQEYVWNDDFLEKEYKFENEVVKKAIDSIFFKKVPVSTEKIENGVIQGNGIGDKNGKWGNWNGVNTIDGIDIKEGGVVIYLKWMDSQNGVIIGFKTEDNDKNVPKLLHEKLNGLINI